MNDSGESYCIIQFFLEAKVLTLVKQKYSQNCTCELADTPVWLKLFLRHNQEQTREEMSVFGG